VVDDLTALPPGIELRPAAAADREFLVALYASTRADELSVVPWSDAEKDAFVRMQFDAQDASYRQNHPAAEFLIVLAAREPIGRLYLARLVDELRVIDLALLPAWRGAGIGSALMAGVLRQADRDGVSVTLHVELRNRARRLYERLGFRSVEEGGVYLFMRRPPRDQLKTAS
jgi:ribosomal protein S18 acetylase RimI-like enzyme